MRIRTLAGFSLLALALLPPGLHAQTDKDKAKGSAIKKCQDATGKWHYGDRAAQECARSKITEISDKGVKKKEIAAPPTAAELEERELRKEELEKERKQTEEHTRRDKLLLSTYAHEDDINFVRDRKLAQIENMIKASEETLKSLRAALARMEAQSVADEGKGDSKGAEQTAKGIAQTKAQIANHEAAIAAKRKEQETLRAQYAAELERYRELKRQQQSKASAPKKQ
jgi:hypothetical protein